jgi:hypothetical protein
VGELILIGMFLLQQAQPQPTGGIAGRIVFRDGLPAARIIVNATAVPVPGRPAAPARTALTDPSGIYRLENLSPGSYYVRANFTGSALLYPGVTTEAEATVVAVTPGPPLGNIDIVVPDFLSGVRVSGRVVFPPGQTPAAGALRAQLGQANAALAADGSFEFHHVFPGSYSIITPSPGAQPVRITVTDRDVSGIELLVPPLIPVSGTVSAEGGARPALSFFFEGPIYRTAVAVQPDGAFTTQLPAGAYMVGVLAGSVSPGGRAPSLGAAAFAPGYYPISLTAGSQNLLTGPLIITSSDAAVRIALAAGRSGGVKVSGRVRTAANDSGADLSRKLTLASMPTNTIVEALINKDGSFEIPKMMPGTYAASFNLTGEVGSAPMTVIVPNRDLTGLEIAAPAPVEIAGRVAVDGNGNPPKFSLTLIRGGNLTVGADSNGTFSVPPADLAMLARSSGAHVVGVNVNALPDGSFRMTLPQGDYRVIPAVNSPAYFVRSMTHGSTRLLTEPLHVASDEPAPLHIGFGTTAANPWKKVSGRVKGLDSSRGLTRVALEGSFTATIETPVNPDGTFEFLSVLPGTTYIARLMPPSDAVSSPPVTVADKDVDGVEIFIPRERDVTIHASAEGNAPVPTFMLSLSGTTVPAANGRTVNASTVSALVKPEPDGSFKARLPEDERRVRISGYPLGYTVKSLTYGSVDLKRNPARFDGVVPTAITVVFALDPAVPLRNIQGRVTGLDPVQGDVRLVLNGAAAFATFETTVGSNGLFSFSKIPQGTYVPTLTGGVASGLLTPTSIAVAGTDITGLEINFPKGSSRPNRPEIEAPPTGATVRDLTGLNSGGLQSANESAAVANLRTVNTAQVTFLNISQGKYGSISDLISAGLLDSTFEGVKAGFTFSVVAMDSDYAAVATPASPDSGRYGYYSTPDAVVRYSPLGILAPPRRGGNAVQ